jgi:hypothetical protein
MTQLEDDYFISLKSTLAMRGTSINLVCTFLFLARVFFMALLAFATGRAYRQNMVWSQN